jgi:hypothetical protein
MTPEGTLQFALIILYSNYQQAIYVDDSIRTIHILSKIKSLQQLRGSQNQEASTLVLSLREALAPISDFV